MTFDEGDAMQTVISDDTYDFVVLRSCLMHIPFESKYALLEKTFVSRSIVLSYARKPVKF